MFLQLDATEVWTLGLFLAYLLLQPLQCPMQYRAIVHYVIPVSIVWNFGNYFCHRWQGIANSVKTYYCSDVIMSAMASRITTLTIGYSTVYSGADQRKHQSSAPLAFGRLIHRWPLNSSHTGPVTRKMFPFDDVIMRVVIHSPTIQTYMNGNSYRYIHWLKRARKISDVMGKYCSKCI